MMCDVKPTTAWKQMPSPYSGSELKTGALDLRITDQRDRRCGWVFHVTAEGSYDGATIAQQGGFLDEKSAKIAAEAWARDFCSRTMQALAGAS